MKTSNTYSIGVILLILGYMCNSKFVGSESLFIAFSVFRYVILAIILFSKMFLSSAVSNLSYESIPFSKKLYILLSLAFFL